jgi:serine/threonine-protein kinase
LLAARDSVAGETARLLQTALGNEIQLRDEREAAGNLDAWSMLQRAEHLRKDAEARIDADSAAGVAMLAQADSLLAVAQASDPKWSEPAVRRAWIALRRARRERKPAEASRWIDGGLAHSEHALAISPRNADALEMRGTLRYEKYVRELGPKDEAATLLRNAEADLLKATEINPSQANAWNVLSQLDYRSKFDPATANIHAQRALEADAYLGAADEVHWRLFATAYDLGIQPKASQWCAEGHRRFAKSPRYVLCRLYIGLMDEQKPDINAAWRDVDALIERTPVARRPLEERRARMLAAAQVARSGLADSARRILVANRTTDRSIDPEGTLMFTEALVRVRLGERAEALRGLTLYLTEFPLHRAGLTRNTWWWKDLRNEPDFKALVGTNP